MIGRAFWFSGILLVASSLAACESTRKILPFVPLFPPSTVSNWPSVIETDPVPLPPLTLGPNEKQKADALIDLLRGKNLVQSEPLMDQIRDLGDAALPSLMESSADIDADIRFKTTILLGEIHSVRSAESLTKRLNDTSEEVAMMAARGLSLIGEPWVAPKLFELFASTSRHPSIRVRVEAARAAAKLGFPQSIPFLLLVVKENTRLADPFGGFKDWEWHERWAWEKMIAAETLQELSGIDTHFDSNQGIPQMEESIQPWILWWETQGSRQPIGNSIRNDQRFQKILGSVREAAGSDDAKVAPFAKWLLAQFKI